MRAPLNASVSRHQPSQEDATDDAAKDRFLKALRKKARRGFSGYPVATIAYYGPNDNVATKVSVGIILAENQEAAFLERWFRETDLRNDPEVHEQILEFIRTHDTKSVVLAECIIGCPHEEGIDYPDNTVCPKCPFWANRDRWSGEVVHQ